MKEDFKPAGESPKILVIRMSSLGDIILTASVYRNIKARWPGARIDLLVKKQFAEAAEKNCFIDGVIGFSGLGDTVRKINGGNYDIIIDLHATLRSWLIRVLARAGKKICYRKDSLARRLFVRFRIPSPSLEKHVLDRYLAVLEQIGVPVVSRAPELGDWRCASECSQPGKRSGKKAPERICVFQTAFLGDCVLTLPLVKQIRELFPRAELSVLTRPETAGIFTSAGLGIEIIEDRKKTEPKIKETVRLVRELKKKNFDAAIIPHRSLRSAYIAYAAGIGTRIGFSSSAGSFFLTHKVPFSWLLHDVERNLSLLNPLTKVLSPEFPGIRPDPSAVSETDIPSSVKAGVNAGSAWPTKRWPAEKWAELVKRLAAETGGPVLLLGGAKEKEWNDSIERMAGASNCLNLTGRTSTSGLMEAIRPLRVFVSNDSGPMHIAAALGVPVVGIFGPTTKELGFFPYGEKSQVVEARLKCRPCALHGSRKCPRGHFLCMKLITVDAVFEAAKDKLDRYGRRAAETIVSPLPAGK